MNLASRCVNTVFHQSEAIPRSGKWRIVSMEFLRLFRRCHLAGKQVVTLPNAGSFLNNNNNNLYLYSLLLKNKLWQATKADMFHHDWNFLQTTLT